jgi:hypothetical protein
LRNVFEIHVWVSDCGKRYEAAQEINFAKNVMLLCSGAGAAKLRHAAAGQRKERRELTVFALFSFGF